MSIHHSVTQPVGLHNGGTLAGAGRMKTKIKQIGNMGFASAPLPLIFPTFMFVVMSYMMSYNNIHVSITSPLGRAQNHNQLFLNEDIWIKSVR